MIVALTRLIEHARKLAAADGAAFFLPLGAARAICTVGVGRAAGLEGLHDLGPESLVRVCMDSGRSVRGATLAGVPEGIPGAAERLEVQSWLLMPVLGPEGVALAVMALVSAREGAFPESVDRAMEIMAGVMVTSLEDLTEAEHAQAKERATIFDSESRFRAFMSALPAIAWVKDEHGR